MPLVCGAARRPCEIRDGDGDFPSKDCLTVEDRCSPVLYLELSEASNEASALRAGELALIPGVQRVTWWENCAPGRADLPMRIRDGSKLIVAEAQGEVHPRSHPEGFPEVHCFRRSPRPSQGVLTDGPTLGLMIVWISPRTPEVVSGPAGLGRFSSYTPYRSGGHTRFHADLGL